MKKVSISGIEDIVNALQHDKVLYLENETNKGHFSRYWMYKGLICQSVDDCPTCKVGVSIYVLPEYKYYYYE